jgi:5-methylcytosine-specific restriction endonuclease McrA
MGIPTYGPKWLSNDPCFFCGRAADTWDHITPRSAQGQCEDNLVRACGSCNRKKKNSTLLTFLVDMKNRNRYRQLYPIKKKRQRIVG